MATDTVAQPRALPVHGVGDNAIIFCEVANGRSPLAYLVDRAAFTDEQWERLNAEAERWAHELSPERTKLRVV
jgi:hypothetical protein